MHVKDAMYFQLSNQIEMASCLVATNKNYSIFSEVKLVVQFLD